jgi:hypothetical protein
MAPKKTATNNATSIKAAAKNAATATTPQTTESTPMQKLEPGEDTVLSYDMQQIKRSEKGIEFAEITQYGLRAVKRFLPAELFALRELWRNTIEPGKWYALINLVGKYMGTDTKITPAIIEQILNLKPMREVPMVGRYSFFDILDALNEKEIKWLSQVATKYTKAYLNNKLWLNDFLISNGNDYQLRDILAISSEQAATEYAIVVTTGKGNLVHVIDSSRYVYALSKGVNVAKVNPDEIAYGVAEELVKLSMTLSEKAEEARNKYKEGNNRKAEADNKRAKQIETEKGTIEKASKLIASAKSAEALDALYKTTSEKIKMRIQLKDELSAFKTAIAKMKADKFPPAPKATTKKGQTALAETLTEMAAITGIPAEEIKALPIITEAAAKA